MARLPSLLLAVLAAAAAAAGCGGGQGTETASSSSRFAAAGTLPPALTEQPAPRFSLTDARSGRRLDTARLRGRPYLITFLFVNCPDVCPLIGQEIRQALEELGADAGAVTAVAVSVDPRHDTPEAVRTWLRRHRQPDNFHYLIGTEAELDPVWRAFYAAPQVVGNPESAHTAVIWLVDKQGRLAAKVNAGVPFDPVDLADDLRLLLAE